MGWCGSSRRDGGGLRWSDIEGRRWEGKERETEGKRGEQRKIESISKCVERKRRKIGYM